MRVLKTASLYDTHTEFVCSSIENYDNYIREKEEEDNTPPKNKPPPPPRRQKRNSNTEWFEEVWRIFTMLLTATTCPQTQINPLSLSNSPEHSNSALLMGAKRIPLHCYILSKFNLKFELIINLPVQCAELQKQKTHSPLIFKLFTVSLHWRNSSRRRKSSESR